MKFIKQFSIILIISLIGRFTTLFHCRFQPASTAAYHARGASDEAHTLDSVQEASFSNRHYAADVHTCRGGTSRFMGASPADPRPIPGHHLVSTVVVMVVSGKITQFL